MGALVLDTVPRRSLFKRDTLGGRKSKGRGAEGESKGRGSWQLILPLVLERLWDAGRTLSCSCLPKTWPEVAAWPADLASNLAVPLWCSVASSQTPSGPCPPPSV